MRGTELSLCSVCAELRIAYTQFKLNSLEKGSVYCNMNYWGERSRKTSLERFKEQNFEKQFLQSKLYLSLAYLGQVSICQIERKKREKG